GVHRPGPLGTGSLGEFLVHHRHRRVTLLSVAARRPEPTRRPRDRSGLVPVLVLPAGLARLPDGLDVPRRLPGRLQLGRTGLVLRLLLGFAVGSVPRAHRGFLHAEWTVARPASRRLTCGFAGGDPARTDPQRIAHFGEASGLNRGPDPGHEV